MITFMLKYFSILSSYDTGISMTKYCLYHLIAMRFPIYFTAFAVMATSEAASKTFSSVALFTDTLNEIQGALEDTINAGADLELMETSLHEIVASSSYFYRTESITEYTVGSLTNSWSSSSSSPSLSSSG